MSDYYNPRRTSRLYTSEKPFRLSRSKLDLFLKCPRCFILDRKYGVGQPPSYPFSLNTAVDTLLKKEFDQHRVKATVHPLAKAYGLNLIPFAHADMKIWQEALHHGIACDVTGTNLTLTGGIDDVWVDPATQELTIIDYKATAKKSEVSLDADWQIGYKRQMEVYQYLFRQNGFTVSSTGYFVYCNGKDQNESFDGKLEFDIKLIPYKGDDSWVEKAVIEAFQVLNQERLPESAEDCDYCRYRRAVDEVSS